MVKRKSPKEIIESESNSKVEHSYVKIGGRELVNVEDEVTELGAYRDNSKVFTAWKSNKKKPLTHVHTHPYDKEKDDYPNALYLNSMPSTGDIKNFLRDDDEHTMIVAQTDNKSGKLFGYFLLRKTKNTPRTGFSSPKLGSLASKVKGYLFGHPKVILSPEMNQDLAIYDQASYSASRSFQESALKRIADNHHLNYRFVGGSLPEVYKGRNYHELKRKKLDKLGSIVLLILIGSIIFSLPVLTGNVIDNLNQKSSNWITGVLFIVGLVCALVYFKRKSK